MPKYKREIKFENGEVMRFDFDTDYPEDIRISACNVPRKEFGFMCLMVNQVKRQAEEFITKGKESAH